MDFQEPDSTKFRFEIDSDSIDTNNALRDIQLRGPSCLESALYKSITFESTSVKAQDVAVSTGKTKRTFQVTGDLSMHGQTREVTIPMELLAIGNGPQGNLRCGFMSRFVVSRSDFGLEGLKESVGDSISVTFCFQVIQQQPEPEKKVETIRFDDDKSEIGAIKAPETEPGKNSETEKLEDLFRPTPKKTETTPEPIQNPFKEDDGSEDDG